jgi:hypothetical protein
MFTMREAPCKPYNVKVWRPRSEILKEAAPDLLEVCKAVLEWHRTFFKLDSELEKKLWLSFFVMPEGRGFEVPPRELRSDLPPLATVAASSSPSLPRRAIDKAEGVKERRPRRSRKGG